MPRYPKDTRHLICAARKAGLSTQQIANAMRCSTGVVYHYAQGRHEATYPRARLLLEKL